MGKLLDSINSMVDNGEYSVDKSEVIDYIYQRLINSDTEDKYILVENKHIIHICNVVYDRDELLRYKAHVLRDLLTELEELTGLNIRDKLTAHKIHSSESHFIYSNLTNRMAKWLSLEIQIRTDSPEPNRAFELLPKGLIDKDYCGNYKYEFVFDDVVSDIRNDKELFAYLIEGFKELLYVIGDGPVTVYSILYEMAELEPTEEFLRDNTIENIKDVDNILRWNLMSTVYNIDSDSKIRSFKYNETINYDSMFKGNKIKLVSKSELQINNRIPSLDFFNFTQSLTVSSEIYRYAPFIIFDKLDTAVIGNTHSSNFASLAHAGLAFSYLFNKGLDYLYKRETIKDFKGISDIESDKDIYGTLATERVLSNVSFSYEPELFSSKTLTDKYIKFIKDNNLFLLLEDNNKIVKLFRLNHKNKLKQIPIFDYIKGGF